MPKITYLESLKVAWLVLWRVGVIAAGLGLLLGLIFVFVGGALEISQSAYSRILYSITIPFFMFYVYPLIIRMALRKQYKGFMLKVVRGVS
jgi:hypothetical protein